MISLERAEQESLIESVFLAKVVFTKEEVGWLDSEIKRLEEEVEILTSRRY